MGFNRIFVLLICAMTFALPAWAINTFTITTNANPLDGGTVSCIPNPINFGSSSTCTAAANAGYAFSNWSGDCSGSSCALNNVQSDKNVTANFVSTYAITTAASPSGGGTVSCTPNPVNHGSSSTCTAIPSAGYTVSSWSGDCSGSSCTLSNVQATKSVTANFTLNTYTITAAVAPSGSGTVTCIPNPVNYGSSSTCTATANAGYVFSNWSGDCNSGSCTLSNVQAAKSVTANFIATYAITTTSSPINGGTVGCSPNPVGYGSSSICWATPNAGYTFFGWSGDCTGLSCSLGGVTTVKSVTANFMPNAWITGGSLTAGRGNHTASLLPSGKVLVAGGIGTSGYLPSAELYDPTTNTWTVAGSLAVARYSHTATVLPSGKVLVAGGAGASGALASAELYDPTTNLWSSAGSLNLGRYNHTATLLPSGNVLIAGGVSDSGAAASAELYDPANNTWSVAGSLHDARYSHTATLISSTKLLVAGGSASSGSLASAELYDIVANSWSTAGSMSAARNSQTATLLPSGKVLAAGGGPASAELYSPTTNTWSTAGSMSVERINHSAVLQPSGKVMVAGGSGSTGPLASVELYEPETNSWSAASSLAEARQAHTATLLPFGKILLTGGVNNSGPTTSVELNDPVVLSWTPAGSMVTPRSDHTATLLTSGKVLVAGGRNPPDSGPTRHYLTSAELYDPISNTWTAAGSLIDTRIGHSATLLPSGKVLVAGGSTGGSAELYDPISNTWTAAGSMTMARAGHAAILLSTGKVLVIGGTATPLSSELYDPASNTWSSARFLTNPSISGIRTSTLLRSGKVLVVESDVNSDLSGGTAPAEIYDPTTNSWSAASKLSKLGSVSAATLLSTGEVLAIGRVAAPIGAPSVIGAELYNPVTDTWGAADSAAAGLTGIPKMVTLLPTGKLLITGVGGCTLLGTCALLYDPASNSWSATSSVTSSSPCNWYVYPSRCGYSVTLLLSGSVLVAGGYHRTYFTGYTEGYGYYGIAEQSVLNLGIDAVRRPLLSSANTPLVIGSALQLTGTRFTGDSEVSGGGVSSSATNYPLVQLRRLNNDQTSWPMPNSARSSTRYVSTALNEVTTGQYAVTMYVNAIPSLTKIVEVVSTGWTVTPSIVGHGTISPATAQVVGDGTTSVFTLTPDTGYSIGNVGGTCGGTISGNTYTTNAVAANCTVIATFTGGPRLINISTRGQVQTGNNVMIAGFVIGAVPPASKSVLIRAVGPNLANFGINGVLQNPVLELHDGSGAIISTNDNWQAATNAAAIQATGLAPVSSLESAILTNLSPGAYTAVVSGASNGTGVGIVEVYEIDHPEYPLINLSTRGQVLTGNDVMIGGFIIQGSASQTVLIRAVGPNLANYGLTGVLANPMLELHDGTGAIIASNDDWQTSSNANYVPNVAAIQATRLAPANPLESAILITLQPGTYTAIVSGAGGSTGVGLVEVFAQ